MSQFTAPARDPVGDRYVTDRRVAKTARSRAERTALWVIAADVVALALLILLLL
ncbi:MAG: hypothetical protein ACLFWM_03280 [Actinomycetota bacterium]